MTDKKMSTDSIVLMMIDRSRTEIGLQYTEALFDLVSSCLYIFFHVEYVGHYRIESIVFRSFFAQSIGWSLRSSGIQPTLGNR